MKIIKGKKRMWQCSGPCKKIEIDYIFIINNFTEFALCEECYKKLKEEMERVDNGK